jgi:hypothetical protein
MKYIKLFESYSIENLLGSTRVYDIHFDGESSKNGYKISIVGKSMDDVLDLYNRLHKWLSLKNIAHKIATKKRIEHSDYEQSKKLVTIYVPDSMNIFELMVKVEVLLKGYDGWHDIKLPFKGYEHFSNAIFFRNDRDQYGNYIPAKLTENVSTKSSGLRFEKMAKKSSAKTDVYKVFNGDDNIGLIKWNSRIMGYSFQPTDDCQEDIKMFIKRLMMKRKNN